MRRNQLSCICRNPVCFIACGFGSGVSKILPGTCGTLVALPFYWVMQTYLSTFSYFLVLILATVFGFWLCTKAERLLNESDPAMIVWDEIVGFLWAMFAAPSGLQWLIAAFILFRVFDILKPWPIQWFERKFSGGVGIMLDDLVAALYTWLIIQTTFMFLVGLD